MRWVAHELAAGTPVDDALAKLSVGGQGALRVALTDILEQASTDSGWSNDPASSSSAYRAAVRFADKTDADLETLLKRMVENAFVARRAKAAQESRRATEDAGIERGA